MKIYSCFFLCYLMYLMAQYIFFSRQLILCYHKVVLEGNRSNYPDKYKITDVLSRVQRLATGHANGRISGWGRALCRQVRLIWLIVAGIVPCYWLPVTPSPRHHHLSPKSHLLPLQHNRSVHRGTIL